MHNSDDPEEIANRSLIAGTEFYDAEWCGVVEVDLFLNKWSPKWWYSKKNKGNIRTKILWHERFYPTIRMD